MECVAIEEGTVCSPRGFSAGGTYTGIKTYGPEPRLDVGLLVSEVPCVAAGIFTRNQVCGAPVTVSREHLENGRAQAIVANSGCSNVALGARGLRDARAMCELAAQRLGLHADDVLVGSTGVIGRPLPMEALQGGIAAVELGPGGGLDFARAIMTTDTVPKSRAAYLEGAGRRYTNGGVAKGSGMAHPDMATVFCFLTSDAPAEASWLQGVLRRVGDRSINMVDVDMDTSTSDSMLVLANGLAGGEPLCDTHPAAAAFEAAMTRVAVDLARDLAADGEGARTLIEVVVEAAATPEDARRAARTVVSSPLVKTMVTGRDPNLGRVVMALGRSGAHIQLDRTNIFIGEHCAFRAGEPTEVQHADIVGAMSGPEVRIRAQLGLGEGQATAWGCDLTEDYVRINADYTT